MPQIVQEGNLFPFELEDIQKLPKWIQVLGADHKQTLAQIGSVWNMEPLPEGFEPEESVDIYVEEQGDPIFTYTVGEDAETKDPHFLPQEFTVFVFEVDSVPRYVQIRGQEVFNKLGGCRLPHGIAFPSE